MPCDENDRIRILLPRPSERTTNTQAKRRSSNVTWNYLIFKMNCKENMNNHEIEELTNKLQNIITTANTIKHRWPVFRHASLSVFSGFPRGRQRMNEK